MSFEPKWVEDSASQIRITDFQAYPLGQKAYVKIATNMEEREGRTSAIKRTRGCLSNQNEIILAIFNIRVYVY